MLKDGNKWFQPLPEFLIEAERLLVKSEDCLNHLQLIKNDRDAIDCMLGNLLKLGKKAEAQAIRGLSELSLHIHDLLEQSHAPMDLDEQFLKALKECFILMAWQLELIDPVTGQLDLDENEHTDLMRVLAEQIDQRNSAPCYPSRPFKVVSIAKTNP